MIWRNDKTEDRDFYNWHERFAFWPTRIGDSTVWLEAYRWRRCDHRELAMVRVHFDVPQLFNVHGLFEYEVPGEVGGHLAIGFYGGLAPTILDLEQKLWLKETDKSEMSGTEATIRADGSARKAALTEVAKSAGNLFLKDVAPPPFTDVSGFGEAAKCVGQSIGAADFAVGPHITATEVRERKVGVYVGPRNSDNVVQIKGGPLSE